MMKYTNFNLNQFITECKNISPKYFNSLNNSNISISDFNLNKRLIVTFLKEYLKHNNNKFNRSQFNLSFFHKFFSELIPKNHPEFLQAPKGKLPEILKNFFNYLSLQNVLKKEVSQGIARELGHKTELTKELNEKNFKLISNQGDLEEYSDRKLNQILKKSKKWILEFLDSNYSKNLSIEEINHSGFIIECFFDYLYNYFLKTPEQIDEGDLEEICLYLFPRKVSAEESCFTAIVPVLSNFFLFLENNGVICNADVLCKKLNNLNKRIIKSAGNPKNWGMAKSLLMNAKAAGIDVNNEEELNRYFNYLNIINLARINMKNRDFWSMKDVEALETKEIIQKLRDFGVPFEEEQFLGDVHRFYSASELENEWKANYAINAKGKDEDFIWMAASVLWKRLAPDVINSKQIDDMMQDGYDLLAKNKIIEGCTLWLKVWGYLKERFRPEMRSISEAEQVFSGLQSLYNWCGDLERELYNAGLKDNKFFEKRIEYCKEFVELFPESNGMYISGMIRAMADSYFALKIIDKGEDAFKELVKNFPENVWGYICWGDQYSNIGSGLYNFDKARSVYKLGLEKCTSDREILLERIKDLEAEREGMKLKEDLLSNYDEFLSKKNLSKNGIKKKIDHAEHFLKFIIFHCEMYDFEIFAEEITTEEILKFLGYWSIQQKIITSKSALIELIRNIKSYMSHFQDYIVFSDEEIKEIRRILNSKEFFIKRFKSFQKINDNMFNDENKIQKLRRWREGYLKWYELDESKKREKERLSKKVRLSKKKRKLFKDII